LGKDREAASLIDIDKIATRYTVFVPVLHLVSCGLYIAGYSTAFGSNIGGLFSASDFFTITIQHLIMTYIVGLGMPLLVILARHRSGKTYAADLIAKEDDPIKKAAMAENNRKTVKFIQWVLPLASLLPIALLLCQIWTGAMREYYLVLNFVLMALLPTLWNTASRLGFFGVRVEFAWVGLAFAVGVYGLGLNSGDRDRRLPFSAFADSHMQCKKHFILRPIGSRFISVTSDDRRHLVDDKCEVKFTFPRSDIIPLESLFALVAKKLTVKEPAKPGRPEAKKIGEALPTPAKSSAGKPLADPRS
jgi:hypothetical protein